MSRPPTSTAFAVVVAILLLVGAGLVAWSAATTVPTTETEGRRVFLASDCGACHALRDAGSAGRVAPDLDLVRPTAEQVERFVVLGAPGMPAYRGVLDEGEIDEVSAYVAEVAGR
jgi:mono/diheme cytochrome c family protein